MTDKEKKSKIADILMDFQEEYSNEVINRPMLASLYAGNILSFIDSLQEEPVGKVWHYQKEEPIDNIADKSRPIIVIYGYNSLNAAGKFRCYEDNSDAIWLSNSYEKWAFIEDLINLSQSVKTSDQEEPVSEELEEASKEWLRPQLDKSYANYGEAKMMELTHFDGYAMLDAIEFGAKWKKEQMIANAIDGDITFDYYGDDDKTYGCIAHDSFCLEDFGLKDRNKVKVIVIKKD